MQKPVNTYVKQNKCAFNINKKVGLLKRKRNTVLNNFSKTDIHMHCNSQILLADVETKMKTQMKTQKWLLFLDIHYRKIAKKLNVGSVYIEVTKGRLTNQLFSQNDVLGVDEFLMLYLRNNSVSSISVKLYYHQNCSV